MPKSRANRGPTEGPRTPELKTRHHMRTSNEQLNREAGTPYRNRRPANRARKRQGGADARRSRRSSTKEADSPSKAEGHSRTPAPDAEATTTTLFYDCSQCYRRKWGSSTPHRGKSYCSNISETTGGWGTATVTTTSRISRLARQPLSPYRKWTEERSDRFSDH